VERAKQRPRRLRLEREAFAAVGRRPRQTQPEPQGHRPHPAPQLHAQPPPAPPLPPVEPSRASSDLVRRASRLAVASKDMIRSVSRSRWYAATGPQPERAAGSAASAASTSSRRSVFRDRRALTARLARPPAGGRRG